MANGQLKPEVKKAVYAASEKNNYLIFSFKSGDLLDFFKQLLNVHLLFSALELVFFNICSAFVCYILNLRTCGLKILAWLARAVMNTISHIIRSSQ